MTPPGLEDNEYTQVTALFARLAALPADDLDFERLRTEIIEICLPPRRSHCPAVSRTRPVTRGSRPSRQSGSGQCSQSLRPCER